MEGVTNSRATLEGLGIRTEATDKKEMSDSDEFMHLMLAQIKNQDPMQPMENGEFLSQLAQFNTAGGVADLQKSFDNVAETLQSNQALQASSMVGRTVVVPSSASPLVNGHFAGSVVVPEGSDRTDVKIYNQDGVLVKTVELGAMKQGVSDFSWDGLDDSGNQMPDGEYEMKATSWYSNGLSEPIPTMANAVVESVTVGRSGQGLALNLDGLGSWRMSDVVQIHQ